MAGFSEETLSNLAEALGNHADVPKLGQALGFNKTKMDMYMATNRVDGVVGWKGTLNMLFDWKKDTLKKDQVSTMKAALLKSGFAELTDEHCKDQVISEVQQPKVAQPDTTSCALPTEKHIRMSSNSHVDFDDILNKVANALPDDNAIDSFGKALGFEVPAISRYIKTNMRDQNVTCRGTLKMLRDWRQTVRKAEERAALGNALEEAGLVQIAESYVK